MWCFVFLNKIWRLQNIKNGTGILVYVLLYSFLFVWKFQNFLTQKQDTSTVQEKLLTSYLILKCLDKIFLLLFKCYLVDPCYFITINYLTSNTQLKWLKESPVIIPTICIIKIWITKPKNVVSALCPNTRHLWTLYYLEKRIFADFSYGF